MIDPLALVGLAAILVIVVLAYDSRHHDDVWRD